MSVLMTMVFLSGCFDAIEEESSVQQSNPSSSQEQSNDAETSDGIENVKQKFHKKDKEGQPAEG